MPTDSNKSAVVHISLILLASGLVVSAAEMKTVDDFRAAAAKANAVLTIPDWEQTPEAVATAMKNAIAKANTALDQIGAQDPGKVTFKSTVVALDDLTYEASLAANRATLIKETNTNPAMRTAAENAVKVFQDWAVGVDYREDVYKAIKAFADTHPKLSGEDEKLVKETLRDYRRAGLELPPEQRKEVEDLRKELSKVGTDFETNIVKSNAPVMFSKADLDGLPESFFASPGIKTGDDVYTVMANVTWQFNTVQENAKSEATRKQLYLVRETLAKDKNVPLLNQMLELRNKIALRLGYKSWDDYQTEVKMAKTGMNAEKYINDLVAGIQPKFDSEIAELQKLKAADTNDPKARIMVWDWRYYSNQRDKQKYEVDKEALRAYFPFQKVLDGMFNIYQSIFGLKFEKIVAPHKWIDDLQLYLVTDSATGEPLGMFYLDMFPREGKFNHFAQFVIISGKLLPNGKYQRPTVALLCNFPPASGDAPSLMTHQDVETLFHEFGHAYIPLLLAPSMAASPERMSQVTLLKRRRKCCKTGFGIRKCWILSLPITAIRPKKFPQKSSRSSTTQSWQMPACFIAASSRSLHSILLCMIHILKRCHTIPWRYRTRSWKKSFCRLIPAQRSSPTLVI